MRGEFERHDTGEVAGQDYRPPVHGELLAQGEVLESELAMAAAEERAESKQVEQRADHRGQCRQIRAERSTCGPPDGVLAKDRYRPEEPIGHTTFSNIWRRLLARARVRYRKPHGLRHTYATRLIAEAVDHGQDGEAILHYVGEQLGHSSIKITVDYYGRLVPTRRRVIVNRLDDGPPRSAQSATNPQQPAEGDPILEDAT